MDKPSEAGQSSGQLLQPVLYSCKKEEGSHQRPHTFTHLLEMPEYFELILCEKDLWSAGATLLTRVLGEQGRTSHRGVLNKDLWPSAVDSSLQDWMRHLACLSWFLCKTISKFGCQTCLDISYCVLIFPKDGNIKEPDVLIFPTLL